MRPYQCGRAACRRQDSKNDDVPRQPDGDAWSWFHDKLGRQPTRSEKTAFRRGWRAYRDEEVAA